MEGNSIPKAPVSCEWETRYITEGGYECQMTLQGPDLQAVMATAKQALESMTKAGCKPQASRSAAAAASENGHGEGKAEEHGPEWCKIHEVDMTKHKKDGQVWYSHKTPAGEWCRGKTNGKGDA